MKLELDQDDVQLLLRLLTDDAANLREVIGKTENYEWRQSMHKDEERLNAIISRLEGLAKQSGAGTQASS